MTQTPRQKLNAAQGELKSALYTAGISTWNRDEIHKLPEKIQELANNFVQLEKEVMASEKLEALVADRTGLLKRLEDKRGALRVHREEVQKENAALYNQVFEGSMSKKPNFQMLGHSAVTARLYRTTSEMLEGTLVEEIHEMIHELNMMEQRIVLLEQEFELDVITECEKWVEVVGSLSAATDEGGTYITLVNNLIKSLIEENGESMYVQFSYLVIKDIDGQKQFDRVLNSQLQPKHGTTLLGIRLTSQYFMMLKETGSHPLDSRETLGAIIWYLTNYVEINNLRRQAKEHTYETFTQEAMVPA